LCNSYVSVLLDELGPARVGLDGVADARVSEVQHAAGAAGPVEQDGPALPAMHAEPQAVKLRAHRGVSVAVDRTDVAQPQELCWLQVFAVRRRDRLADKFSLQIAALVSQACKADCYKVIVIRNAVRQAGHPVAVIQNRKQRAVGESPAAARRARLNQEVRHSDEVIIKPVIDSSDGSQVHQQLSADAQAQSGCVAPAGSAAADVDAAAQSVDERSDAGGRRESCQPANSVSLSSCFGGI
uniref:YTH domain-containing protein n=1 Tax=Macrostomum lignano TaxID=282301 RepID=A0A1I8IGL3_9PLAT